MHKNMNFRMYLFFRIMRSFHTETWSSQKFKVCTSMSRKTVFSKNSIVVRKLCRCVNYLSFLGSKSLAAEGLHSSLDLTNQIILMYGIRWSKLSPTPAFPYGYGNARYIASLISGCWLFGFGGGISLYHGFTGLLHPHALVSPNWVRQFLFNDEYNSASFKSNLY